MYEKKKEKNAYAKNLHFRNICLTTQHNDELFPKSGVHCHSVQ